MYTLLLTGIIGNTSELSCSSSNILSLNIFCYYIIYKYIKYNTYVSLYLQ